MVQYFTIYIFPTGITHTNWVKWEEHETSLICCMKQAVVYMHASSRLQANS